MMVFHKSAIVFMICLATGLTAPVNDSLVQTYVHFRIGGTGRAELLGAITYGQPTELPVDIRLANEEGNRDVILLDNMLKNFLIELKKDGRVIPMEELEYRWEKEISKYAYQVHAAFDPTDLSRLEAGVGIRTSLTLRRRNGEPFDFGDYEISAQFSSQGLRFADETRWRGRLYSSLHRLRVAEVATIDDLKNQYVLQASDYLIKGQLEKALELYRRVVDLEPQNPHYHVALAGVLVRLGKYEEGIEHFERALATPGSDISIVPLPDQLVLAYLAMGKEQQAIKTLKLYITDADQVNKTVRLLKQEVLKRNQ